MFAQAWIERIPTEVALQEELAQAKTVCGGWLVVALKAISAAIEASPSDREFWQERLALLRQAGPIVL